MSFPEETSIYKPLYHEATNRGILPHFLLENGEQEPFFDIRKRGTLQFSSLMQPKK
jgi:hypothetical protein